VVFEAQLARLWAPITSSTANGVSRPLQAIRAFLVID
jgi:hypothetical protein